MKTSSSDPLFAGLIPVKDLPARLGMSRQALHSLTKRETAFPPKIKIGRRAFVSEEAVRRWILSRIEDKAA
jgi:predicted DNA-binding transcriptional regulator AlpA